MICKDCFHYDVCKEHDKIMLTVNNLYELMYQSGVEVSCKQFKSVDIVEEVTRCKDCRQYEADILGDGIGYCNEYRMKMLENDYCSYGERSEI